jgi:hypothetical protein
LAAVSAGGHKARSFFSSIMSGASEPTAKRVVQIVTQIVVNGLLDLLLHGLGLCGLPPIACVRNLRTLILRSPPHGVVSIASCCAPALARNS